ncbi:MAG: hypothetical protein EON95_09235 [Caulobacteraceae bacterium]|nr:MAG: hypothetical protein EON95_09235 [Caulobacteraceae bacterium]
MKDIILYGLIPIVASVIGAIVLPLVKQFRKTLSSSFDDRQSLIGSYTCSWFIEDNGNEVLYAEDVVSITKIDTSKFEGSGKDPRFTYSLSGNISRGGIVSFIYVIINKPMSLTGSGTMIVNPAGSILEGRWYGYVSEGRLDGGLVRWKRIPDIGNRVSHE